jgi:hypothetical protein
MGAFWCCAMLSGGSVSLSGWRAASSTGAIGHKLIEPSILRDYAPAPIECTFYDLYYYSSTKDPSSSSRRIFASNVNSCNNKEYLCIMALARHEAEVNH